MLQLLVLILTYITLLHYNNAYLLHNRPRYITKLNQLKNNNDLTNYPIINSNNFIKQSVINENSDIILDINNNNQYSLLFNSKSIDIISTTVVLLIIMVFGNVQVSSADSFDQVLFDPSKFQPVCPTSDSIYQLLKITANSLIGSENVIEYGPLIASVLLRIRLELCVLESFLYEAVVPFIQQKGVSWVLPLHETIETVLAGTIFAIASNFILLSSTKIITVLIIYVDALTGLPARLLGKLIKKFSDKGSTQNIVGSIFKFYGDIIGTTRQLSEVADTFVGRYLVILTSVYIIFKIVHYRLFNDIFP